MKGEEEEEEASGPNTIPTSIGSKATAATVHLAPLLGLLDLTLSVVRSDVNAWSAHQVTVLFSASARSATATAPRSSCIVMNPKPRLLPVMRSTIRRTCSTFPLVQMVSKIV